MREGFMSIQILQPHNRFRIGSRTRANLSGVHPALVAMVEQAIQLTPVDFCVVEGGGVRSPEQAQDNAKRGTGVLNSMHIRQPDGYGHAVDLVAWVDGMPAWTQSYYKQMRPAILQAAAMVGIPIQHGADWDIDGITGEKGEWDWPHWQFPKRPDRIAAAYDQLNEWRAALGLSAIHLAILDPKHWLTA